MKQSLTKIDKIVIFCRNIERTCGLYSEALGLKVFVQSPQFCQLKDKNNFSIYLQTSNRPAQLLKGYSPILSFKVEDFDQTIKKLAKYQLVMDGEPTKTQIGSCASFMGLDNQLISINNFRQTEQEFLPKEKQQKEQDASADQIKRILEKIKM